MAITPKIKATAETNMVPGQAVAVETNDKGEYIAKRLAVVGREAITVTEDIKAGDRLIIEGDFLRKAKGDEWSKLP